MLRVCFGYIRSLKFNISFRLWYIVALCTTKDTVCSLFIEMCIFCRHICSINDYIQMTSCLFVIFVILVFSSTEHIVECLNIYAYIFNVLVHFTTSTQLSIESPYYCNTTAENYIHGIKPFKVTKVRTEVNSWSHYGYLSHSQGRLPSDLNFHLSLFWTCWMY